MDHYPTLGEAAVAMVNIEREVKPRPNMVAAYGDKYEQFLAACAEHGYVDAKRDA